MFRCTCTCVVLLSLAEFCRGASVTGNGDIAVCSLPGVCHQCGEHGDHGPVPQSGLPPRTAARLTADQLPELVSATAGRRQPAVQAAGGEYADAV